MRIFLKTYLISFCLILKCYASISVQSIPPAAGQSFTFMETANTNEIRGRHIGIGASFFNFQYGHSENPLVSETDGTQKAIIKSISSFDLRSGILLKENLNMSFNLSINSIKTKDEADKIALGDSVAQLKYRLSPLENTYQLALIPEIYLPIGSNDDHLSTGSLGAALRVAITRHFGFFKLSTNLGYRHLPGAKYETLNYTNHFITGLSSEFVINDKFSLNLETIGYFSQPYKSTNSPGEIYLGGLWEFSPLKTLSLGLSQPNVDETNNNSLYLIAGLKTYFDEKEIKKIPPRKKECFVEPFTVTFHSRPFTKKELDSLSNSLPYFVSQDKNYYIKTIQYGEVTNTTKEGIPYVENAQIPFAIDLPDMPPEMSIKRINHVWLKLDVNKLSRDKYVGTEMICLLEEKICSGIPITAKNWNKIQNQNFKIPNDNFGELLLSKPISRVDGNNLYASMLTFPIQKLIENSDETLMKIFYQNGLAKKTIYFAVSDDTYLKNNVSLEISLGVERCL